MSNAPVWLAALVALPAFVIGASFLAVEVERLRLAAVASAIAMVLTALVIAVSPGLRDFSIRSSALTWQPGGEAIVRVDTLSDALLVPPGTVVKSSSGKLARAANRDWYLARTRGIR